MPQVSLLRRAAHELEGLGADGFDTVVVNSVLQYFPNIEYLLQVIEAAARVVRPGGRIFLGDVRNFRLLAAFHASVQLHKAPAALTRSQLLAASRATSVRSENCWSIRRSSPRCDAQSPESAGSKSNSNGGAASTR